MAGHLAALLLALIMLAAGPPASASHDQHPKPLTAPEAFASQIEVRTATAGSASAVLVHIDRYTSDLDRKTMSDALAHGGYPNFLIAVRKAPAVGHVEVGPDKFTVRWAREQPTPHGRNITVVTDTPIYFVGGGRVDAKPRTGFELGVVQLVVDEFGIGLGAMAAAARVKPDGEGGVVVEDYAEKPIKLTLVRRKSQ